MPNSKIPGVIEPVPGPEAFRRADDAAVLSQAATLLLLGAQLRGDEFALRARAEAAGGEKLLEFLPEEDAARFTFPRLQGILADRGGQRGARARCTCACPRRAAPSFGRLARRMVKRGAAAINFMNKF